MSHNFWAGFEKEAGILSSAGNLIGRMGGRVVNRGAQIAAAPGKFTGAVREGYTAARAPVAAVTQAAAPVAAQATQAAAPVATQGSRRFVGARPRTAQGAARNRPTATEYIKRNPQAALPAAAPIAAAKAAPAAAAQAAPAKGSGVLHAIKEKGKKFQGRGTDIVGGGLAGAGGMYLMSGDSGQQSAYGY